MTDNGRSTTSPFPIITSPNAMGLPLPDRDAAESSTRAVVTRSWPEIEAMLTEHRYAAAIEALKALASAMRDATARDDEAWRDTLEASRALVYDAIVEIARVGNIPDHGIAGLNASRTWDRAHGLGLDARRASLEGKRP